MPENIPPLPELEIDGMSLKLTDQRIVDHALRTIYEKRPDLFERMAKREGSSEGGPNDAFVQDFFKFVREELKIVDSLVQPRIFWEARRRARVMYGMPI